MCECKCLLSCPGFNSAGSIVLTLAEPHVHVQITAGEPLEQRANQGVGVVMVGGRVHMPKVEEEKGYLYTDNKQESLPTKI